MIYAKQSLGISGKYVKKGEDIKNQDIIKILDEGQKAPGKFGDQDVFTVQTDKGEFLIGMNQTSINNMIDVFGPDSKNWVGKKVKVWLIQDFKEGKLIWKLYLTHPDQILGQSLDKANEELRQSSIDDIPTVESEPYEN
jgi:hypothetical protein